MTNRIDSISWLPLKFWTDNEHYARTVERAMGEVGMASIGLHHRMEYDQMLGDHKPYWYVVGLYPSTVTKEEIQKQIAAKCDFPIMDDWRETGNK